MNVPEDLFSFFHSLFSVIMCGTVLIESMCVVWYCSTSTRQSVLHTTIVPVISTIALSEVIAVSIRSAINFYPAYDIEHLVIVFYIFFCIF